MVCNPFQQQRPSRRVKCYPTHLQCLCSSAHLSWFKIISDEEFFQGKKLNRPSPSPPSLASLPPWLYFHLEAMLSLSTTQLHLIHNTPGASESSAICLCRSEIQSHYKPSTGLRLKSCVVKHFKEMNRTGTRAHGHGIRANGLLVIFVLPLKC